MKILNTRAIALKRTDKTHLVKITHWSQVLKGPIVVLHSQKV